MHIPYAPHGPRLPPGYKPGRLAHPSGWQETNNARVQAFLDVLKTLPGVTCVSNKPIGTGTKLNDHGVQFKYRSEEDETHNSEEDLRVCDVRAANNFQIS